MINRTILVGIMIVVVSGGTCVAHRREADYSDAPFRTGTNSAYVAALKDQVDTVHANVHFLVETPVGFGPDTRIAVRLSGGSVPIRQLAPYFIFEYHKNRNKVYRVYIPLDLPRSSSSVTVHLESLVIEDGFREYIWKKQAPEVSGIAEGSLGTIRVVPREKDAPELKRFIQSLK